MSSKHTQHISASLRRRPKFLFLEEHAIEYMVNYCQQFVEKQNLLLKVIQPQDFRSQREGTYWLRRANGRPAELNRDGSSAYQNDQ